jgi:uncharacterized protein YlxW (UPF0749 family)
MNVFASGLRHQPWIWQVTGLCFILGLLLAASLQTSSTLQRSGYVRRLGQAPAGGPARTDTVPKLEKRIADLLEEKTKMEQSLAQGTGQAKTLGEELQKVKLLAGLTAVHGPGVVLMMQDSKKKPPSNRLLESQSFIIHDTDIQQAVHELFASGAEAIAVNNQRVMARTSIRCVGPTLLVNGVAVAPPFVIMAIGDPGTLAGGLNLPLGILDNFRRFDPQMVQLDKKSDLTIPAYTGSTDSRWARAVLEEEKSGKAKANP